MKIDAWRPEYAAQDNSLSNGSGGELNRQTWLREMDKAQADMVKDMRAVAAPDVISAENEAHQSTTPAAPLVISHPPITEIASGDKAPVTFAADALSARTNIFKPIQPPEAGRLLNAMNAAFGIANDSAGERENAILALNVRNDRSRATWSAQNVHMEATDDGVVIWIRSADLDRQDVERIVARLRREFSACGAHLQAVYLNGRRLGEA